MRKWVKTASCRLFFVVFNLMTPTPVKKKMRVMSQEATLSKLDSRPACTVWQLPISVPYCFSPHRKKQKEKPGGGRPIPKSSKNHCLQLADELTWQLMTPLPCALMNYVDGIGKSAPLQPSLILWPCCCSNLCWCNIALQMLIHLCLIKCVLMNISLFFRKSSINRSFLEHVLEGPTQATGKYSLIQPCHSGLTILFNFTNMNTKGCTGWCRWVTSESLGLETVSGVRSVRDGPGHSSSGKLSLSSMLHRLEMESSQLRQRQHHSHRAFRKVIAKTTSPFKKYVLLLEAFFPCGVNRIMKRRI